MPDELCDAHGVLPRDFPRMGKTVMAHVVMVCVIMAHTYPYVCRHLGPLNGRMHARVADGRTMSRHVSGHMSRHMSTHTHTCPLTYMSVHNAAYASTTQ